VFALDAVAFRLAMLVFMHWKCNLVKVWSGGAWEYPSHLTRIRVGLLEWVESEVNC